VSIVGFDDIPESAHSLPPLTTVHQDFDEVGRRAVARALAGVEGVAVPAGDAIAPVLIERRSTARR
jgi:DNA-binding LacI/PurR family transcriptional regulator